jgi:opacity protein-like surface antigen
MPLHHPPLLAVALATAAGIALAPSTGLAAGTAPEHAMPDEPPEQSWRYRGHGLVAGFGAGAMADEGVATMNARVMGLLAFSEWATGEAFLGFSHYAAEHAGESLQANGYGFGLGFRVTAPTAWRLRPYGALRVQHVHLDPDHWGAHETVGSNDPDDHHSVHRFGAAVGAGFDAPIVVGSRWRFGVDAEAMALGGPGANAFMQGVATLGLAF